MPDILVDLEDTESPNRGVKKDTFFNGNKVSDMTNGVVSNDSPEKDKQEKEEEKPEDNKAKELPQVSLIKLVR